MLFLTHYLAPVLLIFLGLYFFKQRIEKLSIVALFLALFGFIILLLPQEISFNNSHFVGLTLGTLSAVFFALEITAKKALSHKYNAEVITIWFFILSIIILIPFVSISSIGGLRIFGLATVIFYSGLITLGITLFIAGIKNIKAQHIGILSYLEPLGAIVWGSVILSEFPSLMTYLGGVLILLAGYLVIRKGV